MTVTSLPEKIRNGYRIQIKMNAGWKDSLTYPKIYSRLDALNIVRSLNTYDNNDWRARRVKGK